MGFVSIVKKPPESRSLRSEQTPCDPKRPVKGNTPKGAIRLSFSGLLFQHSVQAKQVDLQRGRKTDTTFAKASLWLRSPNLTLKHEQKGQMPLDFQHDSLPATSSEVSRRLNPQRTTDPIFKNLACIEEKNAQASSPVCFSPDGNA